MSAQRIPTYPIEPVFLQRWSPRAFTGEAIPQETLLQLIEAARWAPSANNAQPWRFIYLLPDAAHWQGLLQTLNENNRRWASQASAFLVLLSKTTHVRPGASEATLLYSHSLDAGAAWAYLALQAEASGWSTHPIGGYDRPALQALLGIPDDYRLEMLVAVGKKGNAEALPDDLRSREQPTPRRPLAEIVAAGQFDFAW
ncbi:MAG TPA: nitroreductase family protein [Methylovorus sp.]|nr:nitroreductase family protein [Methylovorus sp.]